MPTTLRLSIAIAAVSATAACGAARAPLTTSFAQLPDHLNVGDTVTVEGTNGAEVRGRVVRMAPDALVVSGPSAERMLDAGGVLRISACCDSLRNGTLIGLGSGAALGALFGAGFNARGDDAIVGALIFGGIGAGLGIGLDALARLTDWYTAPRRDAQARIGPGAAVGVTVAW